MRIAPSTVFAQIACLFICLACTATAQVDDNRTFSSQVREVSVLFSASDWRGHFVPGLTQSDVKVLDNGQEPQALTYFLHETSVPLKIGIAIDVSDSTGHFFRDQQNAAVLFLQRTLRPSDTAFVVAFSARPTMGQDLTPSLAALTKTVRGLRAGGESTAIFDAVKFSCEQLARNEESTLTRRALILITDGEENSSKATLDDAAYAALQSDVVIFALNTHPVPAQSDPLLNRLSQGTGGKVLHAHGSFELRSAFHSIDEQLRSQYVLGYKPAHWVADRSFHRIQLTVKRRRLHVHCRKGYYAVE